MLTIFNSILYIIYNFFIYICINIKTNTMVDKVEKLRVLIKEYVPYLKVWNEGEVSSSDECVTITFTNSKGKNEYPFLTKEFLIEDIDKVIERYRSKLTNIKEKK